MVYAQPRISPGEFDAQTPQEFWYTNRLPNLGQTTKLCNNLQKKKKKEKEKRTSRILIFAVPADHRLKLKENEKKDTYLDFAQGLKKLWNMKVMVISVVIGTGTGGFGNKRSCGDHPNYRIIEVAQYTEKSSGDLKKITVTQTPVISQRLTLVSKTQK